MAQLQGQMEIKFMWTVKGSWRVSPLGSNEQYTWLPASDLRVSPTVADFLSCSVNSVSAFKAGSLDAAGTYAAPNDVLPTLSRLELHRCQSRAESFSALGVGTVIQREDMHVKYVPISSDEYKKRSMQTRRTDGGVWVG